MPKWRFGSEQAMEIDLLPKIPPSDGYGNVFAYLLTDASAIKLAKVIVDIMTKHGYRPTALIADKDTAIIANPVRK